MIYVHEVILVQLWQTSNQEIIVSDNTKSTNTSTKAK